MRGAASGRQPHPHHQHAQPTAHERRGVAAAAAVRVAAADSRCFARVDAVIQEVGVDAGVAAHYGSVTVAGVAAAAAAATITAPCRWPNERITAHQSRMIVVTATDRVIVCCRGASVVTRKVGVDAGGGGDVPVVIVQKVGVDAGLASHHGRGVVALLLQRGGGNISVAALVQKVGVNTGVASHHGRVVVAPATAHQAAPCGRDRVQAHARVLLRPLQVAPCRRGHLHTQLLNLHLIRPASARPHHTRDNHNRIRAKAGRCAVRLPAQKLHDGSSSSHNKCAAAAGLAHTAPHMQHACAEGAGWHGHVRRHTPPM
eukprot:364413-Chlamydomonas_euryale.AAC.2